MGSPTEPRAYCEEKERKAMRALQEPMYDAEPRHATILQRECARRWPKTFDMRLHCQKREIQAVKQLRRP